MKGVLKVGILATLLATLVTSQAQKAKDDKSHDPKKVLTINDKNWIKQVMHGGEQTHMIILMERLETGESRQLATQWAKLAEETEGSPQVARAYCDLSAQHFCQSFQVKEFPTVLLVKDRKVFAHKQEDWTDFSMEAFTEVSRNVESYVREGERQKYENQDKKSKKKMDQESTLNPFDYIAQKYIPFQVMQAHHMIMTKLINVVFNLVGFGRMSFYFKGIVGYLLILIPGIFYLVASIISVSMDIIDPTPPLQEAEPQKHHQHQHPQPQQAQPIPAQQVTVKDLKEWYQQQAATLKAQEQACTAYIDHLKQFDESKPYPQQPAQTNGVQQRAQAQQAVPQLQQPYQQPAQQYPLKQAQTGKRSKK